MAKVEHIYLNLNKLTYGKMYISYLHVLVSEHSWWPHSYLIHIQIKRKRNKGWGKHWPRGKPSTITLKEKEGEERAKEEKDEEEGKEEEKEEQKEEEEEKLLE